MLAIPDAYLSVKEIIHLNWFKFFVLLDLSNNYTKSYNIEISHSTLLGAPEKGGAFLLWGVFPGWRARAASLPCTWTRWLAQNLWLSFTPRCCGPAGWLLTLRFGGERMVTVGFPCKAVMLLETECPCANSHWAAVYVCPGGHVGQCWEASVVPFCSF